MNSDVASLFEFSLLQTVAGQKLSLRPHPELTEDRTSDGIDECSLEDT